MPTDTAQTIARLEGVSKRYGAVDTAVSDFDGGKITSRFGYRWVATTDQQTGGKSEGSVALVSGGAEMAQLKDIAFCAGPNPGKFRFEIDQVVIR